MFRLINVLFAGNAAQNRSAIHHDGDIGRKPVKMSVCAGELQNIK